MKYTKIEYLSNLLALCTEKQKNLFCRMYPNGPNKYQLSRAISQVENTLKDLNTLKSDLVSIKTAAKDKYIGLEAEFNHLQRILESTKNALNEANNSIEKLITPINTENKAIQERLELLDALEAGGVDNWQWYDESIEDYKQSIEASLEK